MKKNRSFLKWAGGKYPLVTEIRSLLPEGEQLIEPFVGAGTVFLNTHYDEYLLADINSDLIGLYNIVNMYSERFVRDARELFCQEYNAAEPYHQLRDEFNASRNKYRRALLFLYLNRHCYNGLCRYNQKGDFNVPFGRYKKPYFPEEEIFAFAHKAKRATFVCKHYDKTLANARPGSVVYCDPPYAPLSTTANFTAYHSNAFTLHDQMQLASWAEKLLARQVTVLISNHDTEMTRNWYHQATLHVVKVRRSISSKGSHRNQVDELLALYDYRSRTPEQATSKPVVKKLALLAK